MIKGLVAHKILITLGENNEFESGIILYRVRTDGVLDKEQKSIAIKNMAFSKLHLANIIDTVIAGTKKQEGIDG